MALTMTRFDFSSQRNENGCTFGKRDIYNAAFVENKLKFTTSISMNYSCYFILFREFSFCCERDDYAKPLTAAREIYHACLISIFIQTPKIAFHFT